MQKNKKVRWGRGDLSGLFLLLTLSDPYLHSKPAVKEICVRPMFIWWRRGELNPCPKAHSQELLRAQFVVLRSLHNTPANRLIALVESFYMTGATLNPYTFTTNRRPDPEPWSSQAGRASLIRQPVKNNRCCLIYKQLRLLRKRPHFRPLFLLQRPRRNRYAPSSSQSLLSSVSAWRRKLRWLPCSSSPNRPRLRWAPLRMAAAPPGEEFIF